MITVKRFTASWCGPCRMLKPVFNQLETQFPEVKFETYDVDVNPEVITNLNIKSVPMVLMFKENVSNPVVTSVGANPLKYYADTIQELLNNES
jgi:thioredoxin 1